MSKKNPLLKFALIPALFLLLLFSHGGSTLFGDGLTFLPSQVEVPGCAELHFNKTYTGSLAFGEEFTVTIDVPALTETFMVIERRVWRCIDEKEMGLDDAARPLIWWPGELPSDYILLLVHNAVEFPWVEEDTQDDGYRDTFGDGDSFWIDPGAWEVSIFSNDRSDICYELKISVWGCPNWGSSTTPAKPGP